MVDSFPLLSKVINSIMVLETVAYKPALSGMKAPPSFKMIVFPLNVVAETTPTTSKVSVGIIVPIPKLPFFKRVRAVLFYYYRFHFLWSIMDHGLPNCL